MAEHRVTSFLGLLQGDGWSGEQVAGDWWLASRMTRRRKILVRLAESGGSLFFEAAIPTQTDTACRTALFRYLLQLNHELRLARLSLDADDRVHLCAELPLAALSFTAFAGVLSALAGVFESCHREIELMASNRGLAEAWLALLPAAPAELDLRIVSP